MDGMMLLLGATVAAGFLWRSGIADSTAEWLGRIAGRGASWITDEDGAWADLPSRLAYRDFFGDVIETRDGWMWSGLELKPLASDGFGGFDWNAAGNRLNRIFTVMPDKTWVQIVMRQDDSSREGEGVFLRIADGCDSPALKQVLKARARHLRYEAKAGRVVRRRLYAFVGRQMKPGLQRIPLRSLFTSEPFVDLERADFLKLREEVLRLRDGFAAAYVAAGGSVRPIPARIAFELAYERLNPERAETHPAPAYPMPSVAGHPLYKSAHSDGSRKSAGHNEQITYNSLRADLFAENPREELCYTPLEIRGDCFKLGSTKSMGSSCQ